MSINFPSSPTADQKFDSGSRKYRFNDPVWNSEDFTAFFTNHVVNGALQISQENGTTATAAAVSNGGTHIADQWVAYWNMPQVGATVQAHSYAPAIGEGGGGPHPGNAAVLFCSTFNASTNAAAYAQIFQDLEGPKMADFRWGTADARPMVIRFMAMSVKPGTYTVSVHNYDSSRSYIAPFTIVGTNTWEEFVVSIPGDTSGTWPYVNYSTWGYISFNGAIGSNYHGTQSVWQAGNKMSFSGAANWCSTASGYFRIAKVGVYVDGYNTGIAPLWVHPQYSTEELKCMRYWYKAYCLRGVFASATLVGRMAIAHPTEMRTGPAFSWTSGNMTMYDGGVTGFLTGTSVTGYSSLYNIEADISTTAGGFTVGRPACLILTTAADYLAVNARM